MPVAADVDATVRAHLPYVGWLASRYLRTHDVPPSVTRDDLRRAGGEALWRAASRWQPDRAELLTFARPKILSNFRDVVARASRPRPAARGCLSGAADPRSGDAVKRVDDADAFDAMIRPLRDRERQAIRLRYVGGHEYAEIGAALGISESGAWRMIRAAEGRLRKSWAA